MIFCETKDKIRSKSRGIGIKSIFVALFGVIQLLGLSVPSVASAAWATDETRLAYVNYNCFYNPSCQDTYTVPVTDGYLTLVTRVYDGSSFYGSNFYYTTISGSKETLTLGWGGSYFFPNPPAWTVSHPKTNAIGSAAFVVYGREIHYTIDPPTVDPNTKQVTISVRFPKVPQLTYTDWLHGNLTNTSANTQYGFWRDYGRETNTEIVYTAVDASPRTGVTNLYTAEFWFDSYPGHSRGYTSVFVPSDAYLAKVAAQAAQQAAQQVNTIVNDTLTVNAGVVQDNQGTVLQAARDANKKLDNLSQTVTNISQSIPPVLNGIHGLNGATATSSGALQVVIDSSGATQYSYRIDNGGWSPWMPIQDIVSVPVPKGVHTLAVQVANGEIGKPGPAAKTSMQVIGL